MYALPTLYGTIAEDVQPNDYYGPGGFMEMLGYLKQAAAKDASMAKELWMVSEKLTKSQSCTCTH